MLKAIAIDDEPLALTVLESFCKKTDGITLEKTFLKTGEALAFLAGETVDLVFLDINMPALTGTELAKKLPANLPVIFTTAYSEYAVEGFNLNAADYLLKPFTYERFLQAVRKVLLHKQLHAPQYLILKADYRQYRVLLEDILAVEGLDDYLKVHLANARPIVARMTIRAISEMLPGSQFPRVHRSYIINKNKIENVRNKIITVGGLKIPVSKSYEKQFFDDFSASNSSPSPNTDTHED